MAVTLTDEQAKNSAASLRATADVLDPPASPGPTHTPIPPGGGGSTPAPSGFSGRNIPLYELPWPIQFDSKGTSQTNDVIVLVDHWSLSERV
jgi:hypothetical protein